MNQFRQLVHYCTYWFHKYSFHARSQTFLLWQLKFCYKRLPFRNQQRGFQGLVCCVHWKKIPSLWWIMPAIFPTQPLYSNWHKGDVVKWLCKKDILFLRKLCMSFYLRNRSKVPRRHTNEIGYKEVHLPPYNCQYNLIELIWTQYNNHLTFRLINIEQFTQQAYTGSFKKIRQNV